MASVEGGYEDERFDSTIPDNLHCAICLNVLRQPMQCTSNEHFFCRPCITRHLGNTRKCPTCIEPLTLRTLRPSRFVKDLVSQLIIRCDYVGRGCEQMVRVEMLEAHVENCAFSPVHCSNDGCEVIMNRRDQLHHETNECNFRQGKCKVCGENVPYERRKLHCYVTKNEIKEIRDEISNLKEMIVNCMGDMKEQLDQTKQQINDINRQMNNQKREVRQMKRETKALHGSLDVPAEEDWTVRNDIIIAGGFLSFFSYFSGSEPNSVEVFNWPTRQWTLLPQITSVRYRSSSFVYQQQMFVYGGWLDGESMEVLKLTEENGRWEKFSGKLPEWTWGHSSVVYEDNLFIFGGISVDKVFNDIYKVCLVPPYSCELVCRMPEPRSYHGAQCFDSRVFIVGGTTTRDYRGCLNSVLVFDIRTNCCQTISTLPYHVCKMATVAWKDNIVIIGGRNKEGEHLNTVMGYNVENAKVKMLPPMKYKRAECTAVVTGNVMVVMGGEGENNEHLSSVECFNFDLYEWKELPPMNIARCGACAIVNVFCK